jgi:hypothetical protein
VSLIEAGIEYLLVIEYGGRDGIYGTERRPLGVVHEKVALRHARDVLRDHAERIEVFTREVPDWTKVEELTRRDIANLGDRSAT